MGVRCRRDLRRQRLKRFGAILLVIGGILIAGLVWSQKTILKKYSNIDHGDSLAEVMEGIREEDFEVSVAFTTSGKKLFEYTERRANHIELPAEHRRLLEKYDHLILIHNHPRWEHASFSTDDLQFLADYTPEYGIVCGKNRTYILEPDDQWEWSEQLIQFVEDCSDRKERLAVTDEDGKTFFVYVTTEEIMAEAAAKYGMEYHEWSTDEVSSEKIATAILGE